MAPLPSQMFSKKPRIANNYIKNATHVKQLAQETTGQWLNSSKVKMKVVPCMKENLMAVFF